MTPEQKQWFDALTKDRAENANTLEKPSMRGVQRSVVDKYSDQAHFIYELLQNADDAKATSARFILRQDGLVFTHNGSTRFSISNPTTEEADSENGALGHVNAITSIANSNKTGASIGKFGVGFKAVFQYTKTPHIYDPDFRFQIERFIVPRELDTDFSDRKADETVFWFPFDHDQKQPDDCRSEIIEKLKALVFPTLFLSKLETISWQMANETGKYSKTVKRTLNPPGLIARLISLVSEIDEEKSKQDLWLFSPATGNSHSYCVGYALAKGKLKPISQPAFCFFPTKETTNLNFILHAPFLLTDSREGIKAGENHNKEMIQQLAELAADSLPVLRNEKLIDDGILDIIPYDEGRFSELADRRRISFEPFYTAIKNKLRADTLLPTTDGECSSKSCSYWASDTELVGLFGDQQLAQLTGTKEAHWVFQGLGKKEVLNAKKNALADYIDGGDARLWNFREPNLIISSLDPEAILKKITGNFIGAQTQKWLHAFYAYLAERTSYQKFVRDKPIFLDQDGNAVPAFDGDDQLILFLPDEDIAGYTTVKKALLSNKDTREFIEKFGVKKPSLRDEIYNKILPKYDTDDVIDTASHFAKFFRYFKECKHGEIDRFIRLISDKEFLQCKVVNDETIYHGKASDIYLPTADLKAWFETKPDTRFLSLDKYREMVDQEDHDTLTEFFDKLGLRRTPKMLSREISSADLGDQQLSRSGSCHRYADKYLDGCKQIIANINTNRSVLLWNVLTNSDQLHSLRGSHTWFYYTSRSEQFRSREEKRLLTAEWILNKDGELVSADGLTVQSLSDQYDITSAAAMSLIKFLDIPDELVETAHLSDEEMRKIKLAEDIEQSGLSEEEVRAAIEDAKRKKAAQSPADKGKSNERPMPPTDCPVFDDIRKRIASKKGELDDRETGQGASPKLPNGNESAQTETDGDSDDYTPRPVDYSRKIDRAKDRYASEIDRLEREQALLNRADSLPKYSYGWFLALLELECIASVEKNADGKTLSIRFGRIERDGKSARTVILKEPSRFIPQSIEEFSGVRIDLEFANGRPGKLHVESFAAREFSLEGKLASADDLDGIQLSAVVEARIEVQNPSFLLESLLERFRSFGFDEEYDMKANLPENIEFVFGPPGTGKTTHLAEKVLIPLMCGAEEKRVLVLAPTNKAADVLSTRIIEKMGADSSYTNWLVRFGTSSDERIEQAGVWRDRSFNIDGLARSVIVTTIARFAYDGFSMDKGKLYEMDCDFIVVDEASMIPLVNIIYPLYQQKPEKFIIAGDPFQIEPIVAVEQWKCENIYTLTGLTKPGSFRNPVTEPHPFGVTNLKTQFRSIPDIGEVFSRFTYDGMLAHYRGATTQRAMRVNGVEVKPLNLIKFPVSKYESIYRPKKLASGTPYQTYSALFAFEFLGYLAKQVAENHAGEPLFKIGVIAPYRAQANIIDKLVDSWDKKPQNVSVQVGTIHGFQGDECDAIIAVFNPPPKISADPRMFLNKQNILNVAISRARDYLFIITPDAGTENIKSLRKLSRIEHLVKERAGAFSEAASSEIEEIILGSGTYLEENTFSTGHHMVNVYKKAERHYEVRSDDSAVDVQIWRGADGIQ